MYFVLNPFVRGSVGSEETAKVLALSDPKFAGITRKSVREHHEHTLLLLDQHASKPNMQDSVVKRFRFWRLRLPPFCFAWQPLETKSNQIFGMQNTENAVFRYALFLGKTLSKNIPKFGMQNLSSRTTIIIKSRIVWYESFFFLGRTNKS